MINTINNPAEQPLLVNTPAFTNLSYAPPPESGSMAKAANIFFEQPAQNPISSANSPTQQLSPILPNSPGAVKTEAVANKTLLQQTTDQKTLPDSPIPAETKRTLSDEGTQTECLEAEKNLEELSYHSSNQQETAAKSDQTDDKIQTDATTLMLSAHDYYTNDKEDQTQRSEEVPCSPLLESNAYLLPVKNSEKNLDILSKACSSSNTERALSELIYIDIDANDEEESTTSSNTKFPPPRATRRTPPVPVEEDHYTKLLTKTSFKQNPVFTGGVHSFSQKSPNQKESLQEQSFIKFETHKRGGVSPLKHTTTIFSHDRKNCLTLKGKDPFNDITIQYQDLQHSTIFEATTSPDTICISASPPTIKKSLLGVEVENFAITCFSKIDEQKTKCITIDSAGYIEIYFNGKINRHTSFHELDLTKKRDFQQLDREGLSYTMWRSADKHQNPTICFGYYDESKSKEPLFEGISLCWKENQVICCSEIWKNNKKESNASSMKATLDTLLIDTNKISILRNFEIQNKTEKSLVIFHLLQKSLYLKVGKTEHVTRLCEQMEIPISKLC